MFVRDAVIRSIEVGEDAQMAPVLVGHIAELRAPWFAVFSLSFQQLSGFLVAPHQAGNAGDEYGAQHPSSDQLRPQVEAQE
jgi:hypothetical protein